MKLVALKRISDRRQRGSVFDEPNPRAKMLVAIGLAKPYVEPSDPPVEPVAMVPDHVDVEAPPPEPPAPTFTMPRGRGRSSRG